MLIRWDGVLIWPKAFDPAKRRISLKPTINVVCIPAFERFPFIFMALAHVEEHDTSCRRIEQVKQILRAHG